MHAFQNMSTTLNNTAEACMLAIQTLTSAPKAAKDICFVFDPLKHLKTKEPF